MSGVSLSRFVSLIGIFTFAVFLETLYAENFTAQQREILNAFRSKVNAIRGVHDYQKGDGYLARWLFVQKWNLEDAVRKFSAAQRWRELEKVDSSLNETFPEFPPTFLDGIDFEGRPVLTSSLLSLRSFTLQGKRDKLIRYHINTYERAALKVRELSKSTGKDISQITSIVDFQGFNRRDHACIACLEIFAQWAHTEATYYPNFIKNDVWINVPMSAKPVLSTVQYSAPPGINLNVFGTNRTEWSAFLDKIVPADQRTYRFGGTKS